MFADAGEIQRSDICRVKWLIYNAASSVASAGKKTTTKKKNHSTRVNADLQRCCQWWEYTPQSRPREEERYNKAQRRSFRKVQIELGRQVQIKGAIKSTSAQHVQPWGENVEQRGNKNMSERIRHSPPLDVNLCPSVTAIALQTFQICVPADGIKHQK